MLIRNSKYQKKKALGMSQGWEATAADQEMRGPREPASAWMCDALAPSQGALGLSAVFVGLPSCFLSFA
jgi:hypothetical protein